MLLGLEAEVKCGFALLAVASGPWPAWVGVMSWCPTGSVFSGNEFPRMTMRECEVPGLWAVRRSSPGPARVSAPFLTGTGGHGASVVHHELFQTAQKRPAHPSPRETIEDAVRVHACSHGVVLVRSTEGDREGRAATDVPPRAGFALAGA